MADNTDAHFTFVSKALAQQTFSVVRFTGTEGLSRLYEFDILVSSADAEIDLEEVLRNPATLTIRGHDDDVRVHGDVARFEQLQEIRGRYLYRARLVPKLARADLFRQNQLFLDKTVPEILEAVLKRIGLSGRDYTLKLKRSYPKSEYVCQFDETDFAFMSRWMEAEGLYYFFEQGDEAETLVITDSVNAHEEMAGGTLRYVPRSAMNADQETVTALICRQTWLPNRVVLRDYNYRKPSLELKAEAIVDEKGRGDVYSWGEHFKTPEEGKRLAELRAEEIRWTEQVFHGEATAPTMRSGALLSLEGHYRDSYNQKYLLVEITHDGAQPEADVTDASAHETGDAPSLVYQNSFTAIPAGVQFRPTRTTPWPRISGTVNARVDAAGSGKYAEIDGQGRYKVRLPFDESGAVGGKGSRWVRMSQPHAGPNYGFHFPLHKDAEVLLTFVDGDPDRPIIAAAVPNPETASPVGSANQTQSVIRTGGQNEIVIEDTEGGEKVTIQQACGNVLVLDGTKGRETMSMSQACGNSLVLDGTSGAEKSAMRDKYGNQVLLSSSPGDEHITIHSPHHDSGIELGRSNVQWTASNGVTRTAGNKLDVVAGTRGAVLLGSGVDVTIGNQLNAKLAQETSLTLGGRQSVELGYSYTFKRGASLNDCGSDNVSIATQDQILQAGDDVGLLGGAGRKGSVSAVLNLSGTQAMLSVGAKPGVPVPGTPPNVRPLIAAVVATSLAASVAAGHAVGKAGVVGSAIATGILGLAELLLTFGVLWKTRDAKVEPFRHASPTASVELTKQGGVVITSVPATGGIAVDAQSSDIVLRYGAGKSVRIGAFVVRDGQVMARGGMTIQTTSTAPRRAAPLRAR